MPEKWTGELIGKMHNHDITRKQLADELGVTKSYVTMILNGSRKTANGREKLEAAYVAVLKRKEETYSSSAYDLL